MKRILVLIVTVVLAAPAAAETQYVTERLAVPLYIGPSEGPVLRSVEAGSALEVLERRERFVRVRDRTGEAWIDARYLGAEPPARTQLAKSAEELNKLKKELADTQARLKKAEADAGGAAALGAKNAELAKSAEEISKLRKELAAAQAAALSAAQSQARPVPAAAEKPADAAGEKTANGDKPAEKPSAASDDRDGVFLWLALSFAMLVTGFFAGQYWLRENIRRRSGGMYIRI